MLKPNRIRVIGLVFMMAFILNLQNSVAIGPCQNPVFSTLTGQVDYSSSRRCADDNEIKWDFNSCNGYVNPNGSCKVAVTGGVGKIRWEIVRGSAFFDAQQTLTSMVTAAGAKSTTVYLANACGSIEIKASDTICNKSATGPIKSSNGQWKLCARPDTGKVGNWMVGCTQRITWVAGKFKWENWCMRCCKNEEDRLKTGCSWGQCLGEGLDQTTVCADDFGSISCTFGICWEGSSDRDPGHTYYWGCQ